MSQMTIRRFCLRTVLFHALDVGPVVTARKISSSVRQGWKTSRCSGIGRLVVGEELPNGLVESGGPRVDFHYHLDTFQ